MIVHDHPAFGARPPHRVILGVVVRRVLPHERGNQDALQAVVVGPVDLGDRVVGELAPRWVIGMGRETWTAVSEDGNVIDVGEAVRVSKVDGLILTVSRQDEEEEC